MNTRRPSSLITCTGPLRMGLGGPAVARAQLEYLLTMSERDNVTVRVIPFGAGTLPSSGQVIMHAAGEVPELDTVQLDTDHGSEFLDAQPKLVKYRTVLDRMDACALNQKRSRDLIRRIAQSL
jgi:uncharacterized protein DUF5753